MSLSSIRRVGIFPPVNGLNLNWVLYPSRKEPLRERRLRGPNLIARCASVPKNPYSILPPQLQTLVIEIVSAVTGGTSPMRLSKPSPEFIPDHLLFWIVDVAVAVFPRLTSPACYDSLLRGWILLIQPSAPLIARAGFTESRLPVLVFSTRANSNFGAE